MPRSLYAMRKRKTATDLFFFFQRKETFYQIQPQFFNPFPSLNTFTNVNQQLDKSMSFMFISAQTDPNTSKGQLVVYFRRDTRTRKASPCHIMWLERGGQQVHICISALPCPWSQPNPNVWITFGTVGVSSRNCQKYIRSRNMTRGLD